MKLCSVEGCGLKASVHGYCWGHDKQAKRGVAFHPVTPRKHRRGSQLPWLEAHVNYTGDECLIWPFAFHRDGRGQVTIDKRTHQAHRVMCEKAHGPPPTPEHEAAHSCGKGHLGCVHPGHVSWKTHQQNIDDKEVHGTMLRGEQIYCAKLTETQVRDIRRLANVASRRDLADRYGVVPGTITKVIKRALWRHVA
jgi:hypothetical protein